MASIIKNARNGLSINESNLILTELNDSSTSPPLRIDGRGILERRQMKVTCGRRHAQAFAEVNLGRTRVCCTVSSKIVVPPSEHTREGFLKYNVQFGEAFHGNNSGENIKSDIEEKGYSICNILERIFKESNVIDLETLCIIPGEKVYVINCHISVLDNSGNILDAIGYATFHALKHFRRPFITVVGNVVKEYLENEREPLPLSLHHELLFTTFGFCVSLSTNAGFASLENNIEGGNSGVDFNNTNKEDDTSKIIAFVDPTDKEELICKGKLTIVTNSHGELCGMFKIGGLPIETDMLFNCVNIARTSKNSTS